MSFRVVRRNAWMLPLLLLFGCGTKDLRSVITEHKAQVEPQLAKLTAIRAAARAAPALTTDDVNLNGPAPKIGVTDVDEHANVAIEYLEDLDDPTALGNVPYRILGSGSMNRCSAALAYHRYPYNPMLGSVPDELPWYVADGYLKHCAIVRYLFVIRSLAYAGPSDTRQSSGPCPNPSTNDALDAGVSPSNPDAGVLSPCKVYNGGYLQAEVLVFDMKTSANIGGFRFVAESSPKIDVGGSSEHASVVASDFGLKVRTAFNEAAQKHVPGFTVGY